MRNEDRIKAAGVSVGCWVLCGVILLSWLMFSTFMLGKARGAQEAERTDTVRIVTHDTIPVIKPAPIETKTLPDMVVRLPVWAGVKQSGPIDNQLLAKTENLSNIDNQIVADSTPADGEPLYEKSYIPDSVDVIAPIEQKTYTDSTSYRAVITGAWVSLDTMEVYREREVVTIREREKPKRWSVGVGVGYGITPHGMQPWAGLTVSYTLFRL